MHHPAQAELTIVLPCFNPLDGWEKTVWDSFSRLELSSEMPTMQLIIVNDGSTKSLTEAVAFLQSKIPHFIYLSHEKNQGKGAALRTGFRHVQTAYCMFTDIDFPFTDESTIRVYKTLTERDCDVVAGNRSQTYYVDAPPFRRWLSKRFKQLILQWMRIQVQDTQCGLKAFNSKGKDLFLQTTINGYLYDLELFALAAHRAEIHIQTATADLRPGVKFSSMGWQILWRETFHFLQILRKFRLK